MSVGVADGVGGGVAEGGGVGGSLFFILTESLGNCIAKQLSS